MNRHDHCCLCTKAAVIGAKRACPNLCAAEPVLRLRDRAARAARALDTTTRHQRTIIAAGFEPLAAGSQTCFPPVVGNSFDGNSVRTGVPVPARWRRVSCRSNSLLFAVTPLHLYCALPRILKFRVIGLARCGIATIQPGRNTKRARNWGE